MNFKNVYLLLVYLIKRVLERNIITVTSNPLTHK